MEDIVAFNSASLGLPGGHYSHAVSCGDLVYLSGQLGVSAAVSAEKKDLDIESQFRRCMRNAETILKEMGTRLDRTLKVTIYISDIEYWDKVNDIYASLLGEHRPARTIVPVSTLHFGAKVEIDLIATKV